MSASCFLPSSLTGYGYGRLSMAAGLGMIAGNPAGGVLSQFLPWQFIFLATVPLMLALIVFSLRSLPDDSKTIVEKPDKLILMDCLFLGFIASCAIIVLSFGFEFGFSLTPMVGILLVFAVLTVLLVMRARRGKISFFPRAMMVNRMFFVSVLGIVVECCVMRGIVFLMPFYLMSLCALPPAAASLLMLSYAVGFVMSAPFSGTLADKGQLETSTEN